MLPTLGHVGPFVLYTFTVLLDLGIVAGLGWLYLSAKTDGVAQAGRWVDAGLAATLGGLIGARLGYVFANWAYFGAHFGEAIRIWEGGLAWPGAIAGGAIVLWGYCRLRGESFWPIADALTFPILILAALSWIGCATNACAPGREAAPGMLPSWFTVDWPDAFGIKALRWPTQIIGAVWSLLLIPGLWLVRDREWPIGARPLLAIAGIALGAFALAFTRGDQAPQLIGLRLDAVASGMVMVVSLFLFWRRWMPAARRKVGGNGNTPLQVQSDHP
ncbi:MAG: prolipoprotein diacylglyceryl transferase [Chloroflexi bacterium]|nr:prolipoprotein diacylglyceryl transferase [Chloroflexota bacterium]